jgi:hypothetical protein
MGDVTSQLSQVNSITTPYGGYWLWKPKLNVWNDGNWFWEDATSVSPASLDYPHNGFPFTGDPGPYLDPTRKPDGTVLGNNNNYYDGEKWPDGTPNKNWIPKDTPVPGLSLKPGFAPHITGDPVGSGSGGSEPGLPPGFPRYRVRPGSLRDAELAIDASAAAVTVQYSLVNALMAASKSRDVFYAPIGGYEDPWTGGGQEDVPSTDPNPHLDQQLKNVGDVLAKNAADMTRLVGQFGASLNNAGQIFARADRDSVISDG